MAYDATKVIKAIYSIYSHFSINISIIISIAKSECHRIRTEPTMTPAINLAKQLKLDYQLHDYVHDSQAESYGLEAAEKLGVAAEQVFKTLVVQSETATLAVAIVPVNTTVNFKKMAKAIGCKKVQMAEPKQVERSTGYVLGGVSPLGQKKRLLTVIDSAAQAHATIYVSAGRRGLEIELSAQQLADTLNARFADIADHN